MRGRVRALLLVGLVAGCADPLGLDPKLPHQPIASPSPAMSPAASPPASAACPPELATPPGGRTPLGDQAGIYSAFPSPTAWRSYSQEQVREHLAYLRLQKSYWPTFTCQYPDLAAAYERTR